MKIIQFIHGFSVGGAETIVKEYVTNIDKSKFDLVILCLEHHKDSPYEKEIEKKGIRIIYVCDYMKFYSRRRLFFKIINYFQRHYYVKKIIKKENPDIIHSHLRLNQYVKFAKPKSKTKIFHTVHAEPKMLWKSSKDYDFKAAKWLVRKYGMRFIVLHDEMRKEINEMFEVDNSVVLNNGINFDRFNKVLSKEETRRKIGIAEDSFVIGHVGRFNKVKNHMFLVDIFNEIYKRNNAAFLLLIGDGPEKKSIEQRLSELGLDKHYMILSNRTDIPDLLNSMDVFIFPSIREGLGISLIEAQKMKINCFVSDTIPDAAIISNIVTKMSLDLGPVKWADRIIDNKIVDNIIVNSEDWDIKAVVSKLEKIYEE